MAESEIEDVISPTVYREYLRETYGVDTEHESFAGNHKWSVRMKKCFGAHGKLWSDDVEKALKQNITEIFNKADVGQCLIEQKAASLLSMIEVLEKRAHMAYAH